MKLLLILLLVTLIATVLALATKDQKIKMTRGPKFRPSGQKRGELKIKTLFKSANCERRIKKNDMVTLHYRSYLKVSKREIYDTYKEGKPSTFQIGVGHAIKGWDQGLLGLCVGDKIAMYVPPHLHYEGIVQDKVPWESTLVFNPLEILKIEDGQDHGNVFEEIDTNRDGRLDRKEVSDYASAWMKREEPDKATPEALERLVDEIFNDEDKDDDGILTHEEFSGPKHTHDEL